MVMVAFPSLCNVICFYLSGEITQNRRGFMIRPPVQEILRTRFPGVQTPENFIRVPAGLLTTNTGPFSAPHRGQNL